MFAYGSRITQPPTYLISGISLLHLEKQTLQRHLRKTAPALENLKVLLEVDRWDGILALKRSTLLQGQEGTLWLKMELKPKDSVPAGYLCQDCIVQEDLLQIQTSPQNSPSTAKHVGENIHPAQHHTQHQHSASKNAPNACRPEPLSNNHEEHISIHPPFAIAPGPSLIFSWVQISDHILLHIPEAVYLAF